MMWLSKGFVRTVFTHTGVLVLAICVFLIWTRIIHPDTPQVVTDNQVRPVKTEVKIKTVTRLVPVGAKIEFLKAEDVAKRLKIDNPPEDLIAAGKVPPHKGETTVFTSLAGGPDNVYRATMTYRQEPPPWAEWKGFRDSLSGGLYYGIVGSNKFQGEVEYSPVRVWTVHPTAKGTVGIEDNGKINGQLLLGVKF